jgi:hypothetical protein
MGWLDGIKVRSGKAHIKKMLAKESKRSPVIKNINDINSIALLFKIANEEDYNHMNKFAKFLKAEFGIKRVYLMGYWDDPKVNPDFLLTRLDFDFFSRKDLDWKGIPNQSNPIIDNFIQIKFDVIIDMNNYFNIPLRYLLLKTSVGLRIGRNAEENKDFFDFMVASNETEFEEYCNQIIKYLNMVHPA